MDINSAISQLAESISNAPEFRQLKTLRNQVNQNEPLRALLSQFESKQEKFYTSPLPPDQTQRFMNELNDDFARLNTYPLLKQYLSAEQAYNQVISSIIENLNAILDNKLKS